MESEQTKACDQTATMLCSRPNAAPVSTTDLYATWVTLAGLSRRLDALESAERERQQQAADEADAARPPSLRSHAMIGGQSAPAPAAEQQLRKPADQSTCKHPMAMDIPDRKQRCVDCGFVMDRPFIPLDPPAQPAPPPADVVRREVDHPDIEMMAEKVHLAYLNTCHRLGWPPRDTCNVPYIELPADAKELDRASVRAVLSCFPFPSSPAPDVRAEAEMEMWKQCRDVVTVVRVTDQGQTYRNAADVRNECLAAIYSCKPTAPAGAGGEGGGK